MDKLRQQLADEENFEILHAFSRVDQDNKGYIAHQDIERFLEYVEWDSDSNFRENGFRIEFLNIKIFVGSLD